MSNVHTIEIGRSIHQKPGDYCCTYLNDQRIHGGKPWGGFIAERTIKISDNELRAILSSASAE